MTILVTAFDAFGGETRNASSEILAALPDEIRSAQIRKAVVPTAFRRCAAPAEREILALVPDAVLCLGQAGGRDALTPERVAINVMDARIPDNDGFSPVDEPVVPGGPAAYFSTLPLRGMTAAMLERSVPARISDTAGTFVCNCLMYSLLHFAAMHVPALRCGFLHVPYLTGQASPELPAVDLDTAVLGVEAAIGAIAASL